MMKRRLLVCAVAGAAVLAGLPSGAAEIPEEPAERVLARMTLGARIFLASLDDKQLAEAYIPFEDDERFEYKIAPFPPSGGVQYGGLSDQQKILFHNLLSASLSAQGYGKAASIMALEGYLVDLETADGRPSRFHGINLYTIGVFGLPKEDATWGWRLQAHHLSLNFTVVNGALYASGPAFMGAEPHEVWTGQREGWHVLGREENLGRALMGMLSAEQQRTATIAQEMPSDMFTGNARQAMVEGGPQGLRYADMTGEQQEALRSIVMEYVANVPRSLAHTRLRKVEDGGWENIRFAWIGSQTPRERNYYRVHGPKFIIEYVAVALAPNHIHTVWRDIDGDFGRDILAEHHAAHHAE